MNNAGILRDRVIVNMTEDEWDSVVRVHLKGHFAPTHFAANYWREQTKSGREHQRGDREHDVDVGPVLEPGPGQLRRSEVGHRHAHPGDGEGARALRRARRTRSRPRARTRLTLSTPGLGEAIGGTARTVSFDEMDPANVSPMVAYLCTADCTITGETFVVRGGLVQRVQTWTLAEAIDQDERWTVGRARAAAPAS